MFSTKKILTSLGLTIFLLFSSVQIEAGILSGLAKLGKAAKKVDAPNQTGIKHLEIPKKHKDLDSSEIVPNQNGGWDVKLEDGTRVSLDSLKTAGNLGGKLFVIKALDIPKDAAIFKQIPDDIPIYIQGKNNRVFSLSRGTNNTLNYNNVSITLTQSLSIQKAIYHLEKPLFSNKTRFISLSTKTEKALEQTVYGSKIGIEKASLNTFIQQLDNLKHQSIVLSGSIKNGIYYPKSGAKNGIALSELKLAANKNGINLSILESSNPSGLLKTLSKTEALSLSKTPNLSNSIGDFFNRLSIGKNATPIKINVSPDGRSNVAIQFKANASKEAIAKTGSIPNQTHMISLLIRSATIYRPSEEQDTVIDSERRAKIQKQNLLFLYPFLSLILGWTSGMTSRTLWSKIWNINNIPLNESAFVYHLKRFLNRLFFVVLFLPLLGIWCFLYAMLIGVLKLLHTILIKPFLWLYAKLT